MSLTDSLASLASQLPAEALPYAVQLVRDALASDNPTDYLARRAAADAAHEASQAVVREVLGG